MAQPPLDPELAVALGRAETLAKDAALDLIGVGHVVVALFETSSWLRGEYAAADGNADDAAGQVLARLGRGDATGAPARSPRLTAALARAAAAASGPVTIRALLGEIVADADGVVAEVLAPVAAILRPPNIEIAEIRVGAATPLLDRHGRDLVAQARAGTLRPAFGRDDLLDRIAISLVRHTKPHVMLVGDAGVGKTALVEGLAVRIAKGEVPPALAKLRLIAVEPSALVAGASYVGELEQRVRGLIAEASDAGVLLFFDEIHGLFASGSRGMTSADLLKPALGRAEVRVIGATTTTEYDRWVGRDEAMARRFERLEVPEPDATQTLAILTGLRGPLSKHYGLTIDDDALAAAVELTSRHLPARRQPDKALDVLDEACARAVVRGAGGGVGRAEITHVTALRAGVALDALARDDRASLGTLEDRVGARVIGQPEAVATVCRFVVRGRLGLKPADRPEGAILLIGASGVGKSKLAHVIAEEAYGGDAMLRVDLAEYTEQHQVARLIGSPPGYVGHDNEGVLTGWLRRRPHSVVLLDEVDKAHERVRELLLGVLDAGRLTDGRGQQVSCQHALFLLTSAGSAGDVRKELGNELVGRLDAVVAMARLGTMELRRIAELQIAEARARLARNRVTLEIDDAVIRRLAAEADVELGARPIKAAVERTLVDPIAKLLLEKSGPLTVRARVVDGKIIVS